MILLTRIAADHISRRIDAHRHPGLGHLILHPMAGLAIFGTVGNAAHPTLGQAADIGQIINALEEAIAIH
jgi:hypothetical protein